MSLAAGQGFLFFLAEGSIFRGWALAEQGHLDTGIEQIRDGLGAHRAAGVQLGRPSHLALLAEAYARAGRCDEGLAVVEDARAMVAETASAPTRRSCIGSEAICCVRRRSGRAAHRAGS